MQHHVWIVENRNLPHEVAAYRVLSLQNHGPVTAVHGGMHGTPTFGSLADAMKAALAAADADEMRLIQVVTLPSATSAIGGEPALYFFFVRE